MFSTETEKFIIFILFVTALIAFLVGIILFVIKIYQERKKFYERKMEQLKVLHENNLLKSQIQTQENTFQNISREIHDNIGQKLTLAKLQINTLAFADTDFSQPLREVVHMLTQSLDDLRDISRSLSSDMIRSNGLIRAVETEINLIAKTGNYDFKLRVTGETSYLSADDEVIVFRIIQESLTNIIKHAKASHVEIDLIYSSGHLIVRVFDNGKGFDTQSQEYGNGMLNMKNRANFINATFKVESKSGYGTLITCHIPQKNQQNA